MGQKDTAGDPRTDKIRELVEKRNQLNAKVRDMYEEMRAIDLDIANIRRYLQNETQPPASGTRPEPPDTTLQNMGEKS
ncbi:MAG TPA: hypothetical protein VFA76_17680 [Terriglobales bacterium]|nr:hypothetical protein [Terriglobales bacterium]